MLLIKVLLSTKKHIQIQKSLLYSVLIVFLISVIFNSAFMLLNALSVCVTVLVLNLHHRQSVNDVPKWLERFLGSRWMKGSQVHASKLKMTDDVTPDDEAESRSEITKNADATYSVLSSILDEMKKVRDDAKDRANEEVIRLKWKVIAEAVNSVLCAVYIFSGLVTSILCVVLWYQG